MTMTKIKKPSWRNYGKVKPAEVQWYVDDDKGEQISFSVVQINKDVFNCYDEFGWRFF